MKWIRYYSWVLVFALTELNIGFSQWSTDPAENTRVNRWGLNPKVTTDGAGGAIIAWEDDYAWGRDIVAQHVDSSGYNRWAIDGVVICNAELDQYMWAGDIVSDGHGGAFIAWTDHRFSVAPETGYHDSASVYIQHINSAGELMWQENGIRISNGKDWASGIKLIQDGAGGVVAAWINEHDDPPYIYHWPSVITQRITSAGELLWPQDSVRIISSESEPDISLSIINDNRGGFLLSCWEGIFRFDLNGEITWHVADIPGRMTDYSIVSDGAGGAIFYYFNHVNFNYKFYIQRLNNEGVALWGENGILIDTSIPMKYMTSIVQDRVHGAYISWIDSSFIYHYERIDSNGNLLWNDDSLSFGAFFAGRNLLNDNENNVIITYRDSLYSDRGFIQKLNRIGGKEWNNNGALFSYSAMRDSDPTMIGDDNNGAIIVWYERYSNERWGIFAQRVNKYGKLGCITTVIPHFEMDNSSQYYLSQNYPNPFNNQTIIQYKLPQKGKVRLTIFNDYGKEVKTLVVEEEQSKGNYNVIWNGKNNQGGDVASGIYFYQLKVNEFIQTKKLTLIR